MSEITMRPACGDDVPAALELLRDAMGRGSDPRFDALFRWKHVDNPFGPSPAWVAEADGRIVAIRYFMRWELECDGRVRRAVRAVDTATHPDHQGRGLFRRLTLGGVEALRDDGVDFVFNTPNEQSRPGYVSMGWSVVGSLPVWARPTRVTTLMTMARSRVPADHFSVPSTVGDPASDVLGAAREIEALLDARAPSPRLRTRLDLAVLRWRYAGGVVEYRAVREPRALAVFRLRRRGAATEAALALVLAADRRAARRVVQTMRRAVRRAADYVIAMGATRPYGLAPLPRAGPTLTWRGVATDAAVPALAQIDLTLGDIELF